MGSPKLWFVTGSQHLYGEDTLRQVAENSLQVALALTASDEIPLDVDFKPVLTDSTAIRRLCLDANADDDCAGLIVWMHTFSPAKMWIAGLSLLQKPLCHLHTQFNRDLPANSIDMDFMNLNQAAHGDREAGHLHTRLGLSRKVVVGHWTDPEVQQRLGAWARVVRGWNDLQSAKICRFGDNMRDVSVTEGDKVSAQVKFGFSVNGYGLGELAGFVNQVSEAEINRLVDEYSTLYDVAAPLLPGHENESCLRDAARLESGIAAFLTDGGFAGLTTTFEDLHGLTQLPGLACQRLMARGYGFGAEGDWKTAALLRFMKVVGSDLEGGTSFMEDYTYHLDPDRPQVLGAHMLEICPSISSEKPRLEAHALGIGGKADPARLVFDSTTGPALNASLVDLGSRFRLIVNEVVAVQPPKLPKLPVARAVWECKPNFKTAVAAWIHAGGAHHTGYSYAVTTEHLRDFAEIADIEILVIDDHTRIEAFRDSLRWNETYWRSK